MEWPKHRERLKYYIAMFIGTAILAISLVVARGGSALAQPEENCLGVRLCESSSAIPIMAREPLAVAARPDFPLSVKFSPPTPQLVIANSSVINLTLPAGQLLVEQTLDYIQAPILLQSGAGTSTSPSFFTQPKVSICPFASNIPVCLPQQAISQGLADGKWQWYIPVVVNGNIPLSADSRVRLERMGGSGAIQLSLTLIGS